jgi:hypothetical protein
MQKMFTDGLKYHCKFGRFSPLRSRARPEKKAAKRIVKEALLSLGLPDNAN